LLDGSFQGCLGNHSAASTRSKAAAQRLLSNTEKRWTLKLSPSRTLLKSVPSSSCF
jgi:hypothetical protein